MVETEELHKQCGKYGWKWERFYGKAKEDDQGAVVVDLATPFERVSFLLVWAWATHFSFPRKILRVLCGYFEHQKRVQFKRDMAEMAKKVMKKPKEEVEK